MQAFHPTYKVERHKIGFVATYKILEIGKLFIANRSETRGKLLEMFSLEMKLDAEYIGFDGKVLAERAREAKLIVNATPLGMHGID